MRLARDPVLAAFAVCATLVACSQAEESKPQAGAPIDAPPRSEDRAPPANAPSANASEQADLESLPPAPDDGAPDARPAPSGATIRDCGTNLTEPKPIKKTVLWTSTRSVTLGASVVDGKQGTALWATGTPTPPDFTGLESMGGAGPDTSGFASLLGHRDALPLPESWTTLPTDNFSVHVNGKDPLEVFGAAVQPSLRRMTYGMAWSQRSGAYRLVPEKRTTATPTDDTARFVRNFEAHRFVGFALTLTVATDCAAGALADAVGKTASLRQLSGIGGATTGTVLDPAKRAAVQSVLVRDGAFIHLAVISNKPRATLQKIVDESTCSPADLGACEEAVVALEAEAKNLSGEGTLPAYSPLSTAQDANWSVTSFDAWHVVILGPAP
jgi:hypothetical protein